MHNHIQRHFPRDELDIRMKESRSSGTLTASLSAFIPLLRTSPPVRNLRLPLDQDEHEVAYHPFHGSELVSRILASSMLPLHATHLIPPCPS